MERTKVTVWITAPQAGRLRLLSKQQREEQAATYAEMVRRGIPTRDARIEVMGMRAEHWPNLEDVVASAVAQRLAEPDLAGPWRPLNESERAEMALSGRWPGPNLGGLAQRNYAMPSDLVTKLVTASWRVSEKALAQLRRRHLIGAAAAVLDADQRASRNELVAQLHSPARIIRQALERFGPGGSAHAEPGES